MSNITRGGGSTLPGWSFVEQGKKWPIRETVCWSLRWNQSFFFTTHLPGGYPLHLPIHCFFHLIFGNLHRWHRRLEFNRLFTEFRPSFAALWQRYAEHGTRRGGTRFFFFASLLPTNGPFTRAHPQRQLRFMEKRARPPSSLGSTGGDGGLMKPSDNTAWTTQQA